MRASRPSLYSLLLLLLLSPLAHALSAPPCASAATCANGLLDASETLVALATEMENVQHFLSAQPNDLSTLHFAQRMIAMKDDLVGKISAIASFLLARLNPPLEQSALIEHTIFEARVKELHYLLRLADTLYSAYVHFPAVADELLNTVDSVVAAMASETWLAFSAAGENDRRMRAMFGEQNEFDRLLSMLVLAQSDPNQRAALAQLTQQVLQLWQEGKFRDRIHVSTINVASSVQSNNATDEYDEDEGDALGGEADVADDEDTEVIYVNIEGDDARTEEEEEEEPEAPQGRRKGPPPRRA